MKYRLAINADVPKAVKRLPKGIRETLWAKIMALSDDPRPPWSEPLTGVLRPYRKVRVGDYRAAYRVDDDTRLVQVIWAGHRSRVYDELERKR